ncbi:MAG: riboflavin synthase [Candidatus Cloacimonadota bacterium]|nr:riboflavin synthase [Candidatus Cloacimonadota bacterium]
MFTGIIKHLGKAKNIKHSGNKIYLTIFATGFEESLHPADSIACNGACLTVIENRQDSFTVEVTSETLNRTNLKHIKIGNIINLELPMSTDSRFDGHLVQGHIDTVGKLVSKKIISGNSVLEISFPEKYKNLIIEKGSIAVNGISLTITNFQARSFFVNIISYTMENTNLKYIKIGDELNLEFDIIGKYVVNYLEQIKKGKHLLDLI